jgi:hypothetical protein
MALLVLSLRPSAVNCPKPTFVQAGLHVSSTTSVSPLASSEQVLKRCSFMRVETKHDLEFTAPVVLAGFQSWSKSFSDSMKSSVVYPVVPSGCTPLRI